MKKLSLNLITIFSIFFLFFSLTQHSQGSGFKRPSLQGLGCPANGYSYALSPDGQALSILFDTFSVAVPPTNLDYNNNDITSDLNPQKGSKKERRMDHKICLMELPIEIPTGFALDELKIQIDLRGFLYAEYGTTVALSSQFIGYKEKNGHVSLKKTALSKMSYLPKINETISKDFTISDEKRIKFQNVCQHNQKKELSFVVENAILAKMVSTNTNGSASLQIDSADHLIRKMEFKIGLKACHHKNR